MTLYMTISILQSNIVKNRSHFTMGAVSKLSILSIILCLNEFHYVSSTTRDVYSLWQLENLVSSPEQEQSARGLITRLLGDRALDIDVRVRPDFRGQGGRMMASLVAEEGGRLVLKASSGVGAVWALHHYLKHWCGCHVSWQTEQLTLPAQLPAANISLTATDLFRYYQNVCTPGYSFVWWQWPDWERHIDWMALNGVNLPLAFTGQEEIWRRVWTQLGVSEADLASHFTGPAFLPWGRMGNLRGWGGPLGPRWHKHQMGLQHQILARMRSLGMLPVLPAFGGQVPEALTKLHPKSSFTKQTWLNFNSSYSGGYLLSPVDPLFQNIGSMFIKEQTKEFGTSHVYNCDTFNEMRPPNNSASFLASVTRAVFRGMASADPEAVWLMQGWLFLDTEFWAEEQMRAVLTSVRRGKMLILDLDSTNREQYTRAQSYYGQPFIFNMIHTFGGQMAMFGRKESVNQRPAEARALAHSSMVGTGMAMEGIHNAYVMYDLLSEMSWRNEPVPDLDHWFQAYGARRYGLDMPCDEISQAMRILSNSVYNVNTTARNFHGHVLILRHPSLGLKDLAWYEVSEVVTAWGLFVSAASHLGHSPTFLYDLVDLTRQALANIAPIFYLKVKEAYREMESTPLLHENGLVFIDLLKDIEEILSTNKNFLLGPWLESAKALATNEEEKKIYEFNARNQITLWGPNGEILDYAGKQWSGLFSDYYIPRWQLFFKSLEESLVTGRKFHEEKFRKKFLDKIGKPFCEDRSSYSVTPTGDTVGIATKLHRKWSRILGIQM